MGPRQDSNQPFSFYLLQVSAFLLRSHGLLGEYLPLALRTGFRYTNLLIIVIRAGLRNNNMFVGGECCRWRANKVFAALLEIKRRWQLLSAYYYLQFVTLWLP